MATCGFLAVLCLNPAQVEGGKVLFAVSLRFECPVRRSDR
jgi:hypothetical protein